MTNEQNITQILVEKGIIKYIPFSWEEHCDLVIRYCPTLFDTNKYDWKYYSREIAKYAPQHFDPKKYNWKEDSWAVIKYCPEKIDINKINLKNIIKKLPKYKGMSLEEIKKHALLNKL